MANPINSQSQDPYKILFQVMRLIGPHQQELAALFSQNKITDVAQKFFRILAASGLLQFQEQEWKHLQDEFTKNSITITTISKLIFFGLNEDAIIAKCPASGLFDEV